MTNETPPINAAQQQWHEKERQTNVYNKNCYAKWEKRIAAE